MHTVRKEDRESIKFSELNKEMYGDQKKNL